MTTRRQRRDKPRRGTRDGATAVEFALVAFPLFFMILAILEVAMVFVASTVLEKAVFYSGRKIRTGNHQQTTLSMTGVQSEQEFIDDICKNMSIFSSGCNKTTLFVDVRTPETFSQSGAPNPVKANKTFDDSDLQFNPGESEDIVLVRAFYKWPLMTPVMNKALSSIGDGTAVLTASATFRNEPFGSIQSPPS